MPRARRFLQTFLRQLQEGISEHVAWFDDYVRHYSVRSCRSGDTFGANVNRSGWLTCRPRAECSNIARCRAYADRDVRHSAASPLDVPSGSPVKDRKSVYGSLQERCSVGIIAMLEFSRTLAQLAELYIAPVGRDYWAY